MPITKEQFLHLPNYCSILSENINLVRQTLENLENLGLRHLLSGPKSLPDQIGNNFTIIEMCLARYDSSDKSSLEPINKLAALPDSLCSNSHLGYKKATVRQSIPACFEIFFSKVEELKSSFTPAQSQQVEDNMLILRASISRVIRMCDLISERFSENQPTKT